MTSATTPRFGNGTMKARHGVKDGVLMRARAVGIAGDVESLQLALGAAIGVYDQILATAPPQFKPLVLGAGENAIAVARKILEDV